MRGRSSESGSTVHGNNNRFGHQADFVAYPQNSLRVLLRLLLGAESLGLERLVAHCQEFNLVVSHMTIVSPGEAGCRMSKGVERAIRNPKFCISIRRSGPTAHISIWGNPQAEAKPETAT